MERVASLPHLRSPALDNPSTAKPRREKGHASFSPSAAAVPTSTLLQSAPSPPPPPCFATSASKALVSCKQTHAHFLRTELDPIRVMPTSGLVESYAELGDFRSAAMVLYVCLGENTASWSYLTDGFWTEGGHRRRYVEIFKEWHRGGVVLCVKFMIFAMKVCAYFTDWWVGLGIHALAFKMGMDCDVNLRCCIMEFYENCGGAAQADELLDDGAPLLWDKAVSVNAQIGMWFRVLELFGKMQTRQVGADEVTISKVIQACGRIGALKEGKQAHGFIFRSGFSSCLLISNSLISMYSKASSMVLARRVFQSMGAPNLVSWNSIISGYASNGYLDEAWSLFKAMISYDVNPDVVTWNCLISGHAHNRSKNKVLELFRSMQAVGLKPNSSTLTSVLQVFAELGMLRFGMEVHGHAIRHALEGNIYVGTSMIDMYIKCDDLMHAQKMFDSMNHRNVIAWNSLISGYAFKGLFDEALGLLNQMGQAGVEPDLTTWNGLISGFSMHGFKTQALMLIHQLKVLGEKPNVVSWTAFISGCCQNGHYGDALGCLIEMQNEGIEPNSSTIASLLRACAGLALLETGKELHCIAVRKGLDSDIFVSTALVNMYSKSGSLRNALRAFRKIKNKSLSSWNAMVMGFAMYGLAQEASSLFNEMCASGIEPDGITFTALLCGCKHAGLVSEGWKYFDIMKQNYKLVPTPEHYACMVDLLGKAGYLDEAWDFIQTMPLEPDASMWGALLGACRSYENLQLAEVAAEHLFKLEPHNSANYLLMMGIYASRKQWEDVEKLKDAMKILGLKSRAGWSWIHIGQTLHVFSVEGKPHPDMGEICFELYQMVLEMKKLGYVPDTRCIAQNIDEAEKEKMLMGHTEKLAITYGLIHTDDSAPIRVIKNARVCNDCHTMAKYISKINEREIFLRDGVRFHHFVNGKCSCNDHW